MVDKSVKTLTDLTTKDLKVLPEGKSRKLVQTVTVSEKNNQKIGVIEQIDGQTTTGEIESPVTECTIDLTISAKTALDAYSSIEINLRHGDEVDKKVFFINEVPSSEIKETNVENSLFTLEIRVDTEETFLKKLYERFESWDPLYCGNPCGKLIEHSRRI